MLPDTRNPLDHVCRPPSVTGPVRRVAAAAAAPGDHGAAGTDLGVGEATSKEAREETVHRLHVVGAEHPAEVVVQLKVGRRAGGRRLVHCSDDVRTGRTT